MIFEVYDNDSPTVYVSEILSNHEMFNTCSFLNGYRKVQVGNDQEKAQSERDFHYKNRGGKKSNQQSGTYTMKTYSKPNEQLFFQ